MSAESIFVAIGRENTLHIIEGYESDPDMLKKHVDLTQCSSGTREALKYVHGCCLAQTAGGYFVNVTVVPRDLKAANHAIFTSTIAPLLAAERINLIRSAFVKALRGLNIEEMARDSRKTAWPTRPDLMS